MNAPLAGKTIWLTRPAHQARAWADRLEAAGAVVLCEPLLAIEAPADPDAARAGLARAADADFVIASSVNAVSAAWQLVPDFTPRGALYGVGAASADALESACARPVAQPDGCYSSEDLLALDALAMTTGKRVALLAGEGGRTAIADDLRGRGAQVEKIALYRRRLCAIAPTRLAELLAASDAIVVTSAQALSHLGRLADNADHPGLWQAFEACLLVAPSLRVVKQGNQRLRWVRAPVIVDRVSGDAVVAALAQAWRSNRQ